MNNEIQKIKCGYVAVVGRPNVGKSTLLNHILGQKLSIVTAKPQTTRNRVLAIHNSADSQVIFLDTPGIHRPEGSLGHYMNEAADGAIMEADVCLWLIDTADKNRKEGLSKAEQAVARRFVEHKVKAIAVLNKVDILKPKERLLPLMEEASNLENVEEFIPISAKTGDGVDIVMNAILERLPEAERLFPEDVLSDKADRFFVSELVREALTHVTHKEIPYKTAVVIDRFIEESKQVQIHATIHVERDSQKGIIIGKGGSKLKEIGIRAREEAETMLDCRVNLILHVNVTPDWTTNPAGLQKMGYE